MRITVMRPGRSLRRSRAIRMAGLAGIAILIRGIGLTAQPGDPSATVATGHETIPNPVYGSSHRVVAACKGAGAPCPWEQPTTWTTGAVPDDGSRVIIDGLVRVQSDLALAESVGVYPGGRLSFAAGVSTRLRTGDLVVFAGGTLEVGTSAVPIAASAAAEIVIRDRAFAADPAQHLRGLVAVDGTLRMHGRRVAEAFLRTSAPPAAGSSTMRLGSSALAAGWQPGDTVLVPKSSQCRVHSGPCAENETETRVLAATSGASPCTGATTASSRTTSWTARPGPASPRRTPARRATCCAATSSCAWWVATARARRTRTPATARSWAGPAWVTGSTAAVGTCAARADPPRG